MFLFSLLSFNSSIYSSLSIETRRHCCRKTITSRLNELLLGDLRTNRERVILPSSRSEVTKKKYSSLTNQHSVIWPSMLLTFHKLRHHLFFLSRYRKTIINQSAREFSMSDFLKYKKYVLYFCVRHSWTWQSTSSLLVLPVVLASISINM